MTAKNSLCSEDIDFAVTDTYIMFESHILSCSEGIDMTKKGCIPWNIGKRHSEKTKRKISKSHTGFKHTEESKKKMSASRKGRRLPSFSEEHKKKLSESHKGKIPWNRGKKGIYSKEQRQNKSDSMKGNNFHKGKRHTNSLKKRLSELRRGNGNPNWGKKHSMESRKKMSEWQIGDKSPHWIDGRSYEPYCLEFRDDLKERIRERDNRTCQLCGIKENGVKLDVHHIYYDKKNNNPDLISLCRKCNAKVNFNRDYYEGLFMNKLTEPEEIQRKKSKTRG